MANFVNNVPTTNEAISVAGPRPARAVRDVHGGLRRTRSRAYRPTTVLGEELEQALVDFAADWQAGDATDLQAGLDEATQQTQNALDQAQL